MTRRARLHNLQGVGGSVRFHVDEPPADKVGKVWAPLLGPAICILVSGVAV